MQRLVWQAGSSGTALMQRAWIVSVRHTFRYLVCPHSRAVLEGAVIRRSLLRIANGGGSGIQTDTEHLLHLIRSPQVADARHSHTGPSSRREMTMWFSPTAQAGWPTASGPNKLLISVSGNQLVEGCGGRSPGVWTAGEAA